MKTSDKLQPGEALGNYEIIRELATGGMATIYLARIRGTAGFEKNVVLKCILPYLASEHGFVTMFLDEARLAATLRHPNIADVFDVGVADGTYFFAMEYVHGQNAREVRLKAKQQAMPVPLGVGLAIASGTASALSYAHTRTGPQGALNLVHRDVSPSNILVSFDGAVKLVDFGIARASSRRNKTRTGMRKGKAPYLSPEQCQGVTIDWRSDLFSLGTVIYELTTGNRPFIGNSEFEIMDQIVTCSPEPPTQIVPDYPIKLEQIVLKLLARELEARYQTAGEALDDLEALATEQGIPTTAQVVAKYMRELFRDTTPLPDRDTSPDFRTPGGRVTLEYPVAGAPTEEHAAVTPAADEEPTASFQRAEQLWASERMVKMPRPRRVSTEHSAVGDEHTHTAPLDTTVFDVVPPFDPIDARSVELLEGLDADAPADETDDARACRRINHLLHEATRATAAGEAEKAVTAVELAIDEDNGSPAAQDLLQHGVEIMITAYEALLQDPYRVPVLVHSLQQLAGVAMDARTRLLLPWIDGQASIRQILESSGMPRLEAYHHLSQLLLRGIIR